MLRATLLLVVALALPASADISASRTFSYELPTGETAKSQLFLPLDGLDLSERPVVFVIPEWWGLNQYAQMRAMQLAEAGYIAVALDMYGDGEDHRGPVRSW